MKFPDSYCRKCGDMNHAAFFAPVFVAGIDARDGSKHEQGVGTHICIACAIANGFADQQGNLKPGVQL